jgi:Response regulator containing a CheY-like receiver domain and an HTH DNA-binding domain
MVVKCICNDLFIMCKSAHSFMMKQFEMICGDKISLMPQIMEANTGEVELDKIDLKILKLLAEGNSNKSIAEQVNFSEGTVKNRISRVLNLLGIKDRTQLVVYALKNNLI